MPLEIEQWFSGEIPPADIPWPALMPPDCDRLLHWWWEYWREHPQAVPPPYVRGALRNHWDAYLAAHPGAMMPDGLAGMIGDD
ncbi:MAG: hypothetical protein HYY78_01880 [Betaproteobacteria bacterium]|nr:hypothetical protein [Betaproteobacteria bacterium]